MKLYLITQSVTGGYDTYNGFVVAAKDEKAARMMHPDNEDGYPEEEDNWNCWCNIKDVKITYLGQAKEGTKAGKILVSFNAG